MSLLTARQGDLCGSDSVEGSELSKYLSIHDVERKAESPMNNVIPIGQQLCRNVSDAELTS